MAHLPSGRKGTINVAMKVARRKVSDSENFASFRTSHLQHADGLGVGPALPSTGTSRDFVVSKRHVCELRVGFDLMKRAWAERGAELEKPMEE